MRYDTAGAFRTALESRLNRQALDAPGGLVRLRKLVAFERFLARIQAPGHAGWLLKGGFALQLRLGTRARATRNVDLCGDLAAFAGASPNRLHQDLVGRATHDLGDYFGFRVQASRALALKAGPVRVYRFPVEASLGGRTFESFHVDAGVGDPPLAPPVELAASGILDFADLPPVRFRAIAPVQHFSEKIHALTLPRDGAENSRTRDLADVMLLLDLGLPDPPAVRRVLEGTFASRGTHPLPSVLPLPPASWAPEYERLANDLQLKERAMDQATARLEAYWRIVFP